MFKIFHNTKNNYICKGTSDKLTQSPIEKCAELPSRQQAQVIDKQDSEIRNLQIMAKYNPCLKWYM